MSRFAVVFALGLCAALAPAAPVPRAVAEKERFAERWGTLNGAGEVEARGRELTLRSAPLGGYWWRKTMSPGVATVSRRVSGDFAVTVKVLDASGPSAKWAGRDERGTWAGLYLGTDAARFEALLEQQLGERADGTLADEPYSMFCTFEYSQTGGGGGGGSIERNGPVVYLRLTRRGDAISGSYRLEAGKWSEPRQSTTEFAFPNEIEVGVFVGSGVTRTVSATFADLTIEPLKPEAKK